MTVEIPARDDVAVEGAEDAEQSLEVFLQQWDADYKRQANEIDLFNPELTAQWSLEQRQYFIRVFYHVRGHFYRFLWLLGNTAPDKKAKEAILYNFSEEFGGDNSSHEQLYCRFADKFGVDLSSEILYEENHLSFIREFNIKHLSWLYYHNWAEKFATFSAYERLDNIDYDNLLKLAVSLGVANDEFQFFTIHNHAGHFDRTKKELNKIWSIFPEKVKSSFEFIGNHQINLWETLSKTVFAWKETIEL